MHSPSGWSRVSSFHKQEYLRCLCLNLRLFKKFVRFWVHGILHCLNLLFDFIGGVEAGAACFAVDSLGVSIPMVARNADHITRLKRDVVAIAWLVRVDSELVMGVLPTEVVDVIEGIEEG